MVAESFACPGMMYTGALRLRPLYFNSTMSPVSNPSLTAVEGLSQTPLSQVTLFWGFGNSCSHPLLLHAPSQMVGSGRRISSIPCVGPGACMGGAFAVTLATFAAVFGTRPSCSDLSQKASKFDSVVRDCQYAFTMSCGVPPF